MTPGEALVARIYNYVKTVEPPHLVEPVTRATAQAVAILMNEPAFTAELRIVAELREENQWLKSQLTQTQRVLLVSASRATSTPGKRGSTSKKASTKRPAASSASKASRSGRVGGNAPRSAKAAFIKGTRSAKR